MLRLHNKELQKCFLTPQDYGFLSQTQIYVALYGYNSWMQHKSPPLHIHTFLTRDCR